MSQNSFVDAVIIKKLSFTLIKTKFKPTIFFLVKLSFQSKIGKGVAIFHYQMSFKKDMEI